MDQRDIDLLEQNGWEVECESPFEIRHEESNSFATNAAAYTVLVNIRENNGDTPTTRMRNVHRLLYSSSTFYNTNDL